MSAKPQLERRLRGAIRHFWTTREMQAQNQGSVTGAKDAGARAAVTGGAQMNGFVALVRDLLCEHGLPEAQVSCGKDVELPGWYRPEKKWDLLIVSNTGGGHRQRDGSVGGLPRRGLQAVRTALARLLDALGGGSRFNEPGPKPRASF
jgi:hypothetical protein